MVYFEKNRSYVNRHSLTFTHTGEELLAKTQLLHRQFREKELAARNLTADLLKDPQIHHEDKRVVAAKDDILEYGKNREQCAVWAHEFERTPEREFSLGIKDVAFFGLFPMNGPVPYDAAAKRGEWKFTYKGSDLSVPLLAKISSLVDERSEAEKDDRAVIDEEIVENSLLMEEFKRNPEKEVLFSLGDVVYLNLAPLLKAKDE